VSKSRVTVLWLASVILLSALAAQSWGSFELSSEAGGGVLQVSGFVAIPIIGTLLILQVICVSISFLVPILINRVLSATLATMILWNLADVFLNSTSHVQLALVRLVADKTGVIQEIASNGFIVSTSAGPYALLYVLAAALNIFVLLRFVLSPQKRTSSRTLGERSHNLPEDIWANQN